MAAHDTSVEHRPLFAFEPSEFLELDGLYEHWQPAPVPTPELLIANDQLAAELGVDAATLRSPGGVDLVAGNAVQPGSSPVAQAYAGHQFGGFSPRLGDGRALLLGEVLDVRGRRRDIHLKGSGRTPFARGGDGKAAVGPMLREYVIGEAMHALGIPTTRALAVVATGEPVARDTVLPGAVLARVASSHLRVGSFQYAATLDAGRPENPSLVRRLADHAIRRHHLGAAGAEHPYVAFLDAVVEAQASLVARWMLVGFVHGVMNTDNTTISGETIDYGPCAFMEQYDPATVYSSIDHGGRYAYGNQPSIVQWNLARLAEAMLPLLGRDVDEAVAIATEVLESFPARYGDHWSAGMRAKLGLVAAAPDDGEVRDGTMRDGELIDDLLGLLHAHGVDFTTFFRSLASSLRGDDGVRSLFDEHAAFDAWSQRWRAAVASTGRDLSAVAAGMDRVNPVCIARNHMVEAALAAATDGDMEPFERLVEVVTRPFDERPGLEAYAAPAPATFGRYQTFCGT